MVPATDGCQSLKEVVTVSYSLPITITITFLGNGLLDPALYFSVKTIISGNPFLGSTIIYWYIHTFGYVFHEIEMDY